jgi:hypothetical protein
MINELLPAESMMPLKSWTRTARSLKKGSKLYEKKVEEMKKQLAHMFKYFSDVERMHEEVGSFYTRLNTDGNAEMVFFDCEGQRQIEGMIFFPGSSAGSVVMVGRRKRKEKKKVFFPWLTLLTSRLRCSTL